MLLSFMVKILRMETSLVTFYTIVCLGRKGVECVQYLSINLIEFQDLNHQTDSTLRMKALNHKLSDCCVELLP